jgi:hypothetical protein
MSQEVEVKIKVDGSEAEKSLGTLKQQLKAAKAEVLALSDEFGITSQQAIKAAEKAAALGHEISAANKLVKTFNPSSTLNSTTQALGSLQEGFEAASSSMKVVGVESSFVESSMDKVGAAMDLTSGITSIQESVGAYRNLGATLKSFSIVQKIITLGQKLWNAAMTANPIGTIILAITALIAAGVALTNYFKSNAEASEKNEQSIKQNTKALENQSKTADKTAKSIQTNSDYQLAMAKASGASTSAIRKLELKLIDEKIAYANSSREIAKNTYHKNLNALASLKASGADEEQIKAQEELTKKSLEEFVKQTKNLNDANSEKGNLIRKQNVEITQEQTNHNKKIREKNKEATEKARLDAIAAAKALAAEKKKNDEEIAKLYRDKQIEEGYKAQDDLEAAAKANSDRLLSAQQLDIKNENDAYKIKYDNAVKAGLDIQELEKDHNSKLDIIKQNYKEKADEEKIAMIALDLENDAISFEAKKQLILDREAILLEDQTLTESEKKRIHKESVDAQIAVEKAKFQAQQIMLSKTSETLDKGAEVLGKNTAVGKSMAVASALINTYQGITAELATKTVTPFEIGLKVANVAIIAATGFKAVKNILAVKTPGGGGGGGAAGGSMGSISAPASAQPSINVVGASKTNAIAETIAQQGQQPIKAYVVANDVTTQQGLDRNIVSSASIG